MHTPGTNASVRAHSRMREQKMVCILFLVEFLSRGFYNTSLSKCLASLSQVENERQLWTQHPKLP